MDLEVLPIDKENIKMMPDRFTIEVEGVQLIFQFSYNVEDKKFYFNIYEEDETPIIQGRRLVYGEDMLENIHNDYLPSDVKIIPLDFSGEESEITYNTLMESIKPYIFPGDFDVVW